MTRIFGLTILIASTLALSACGSDNPKGFICPASSALIDTASRTELRPGSSDPSGTIYRVEITRVFSECSLDEDTGAVSTRVQIDFAATRPPQGESAQYTVPYFIGVSQEGTSVVDKKMYQVQFAFAPGQASAKFSDRVENFMLQPAPDKKATDYELLAGLQLTQEQLDYNRKVGRYSR